jgi:hypothetical protein
MHPKILLSSFLFLILACTSDEKELRVSGDASSSDTSAMQFDASQADNLLGQPDATRGNEVSTDLREEDLRADNGQDLEIRFTRAYGMCIGLCRTTLLITATVAEIQFSPFSEMAEPSITKTVTLTETARMAIFSAALEALTHPWDPRYGCPDCADQGRYDVQITSSVGKRETVLDPSDHPQFFDSLITQLDPIFASNPVPRTICTTTACENGEVSLVLTLVGQSVKPTWYNDTTQTIYLPGCTTVTFDLVKNGKIEPLGPAAVCAWEGTARSVLPYTTYSDLPLTLKSDGSYRAVGSYGLGCTADKPLSQAACSSSLSVISNTIDTKAAICASAIAGEPCASEGISCSDQCKDICSFCHIFRCDMGHWMALEAAPAPCFACGPNLRCQSNIQYCQETLSGLQGGNSGYSCNDLPTTCKPEQSCSCLVPQVGSICKEISPGGLQVSIALP